VRVAQQTLRAAWLTDGNRCTKHLFSYLRIRSAGNQLKAVMSLSGELLTTTPSILEEASKFYKAHLNEDTTSTAPTAAFDRLYLLSHLLDRLDPDLSYSLSLPITEVEVLSALQLLPKGRVPGPDGIPIEFYCIF
jgi:hypothetical protein